jgi:hypothetical protein
MPLNHEMGQIELHHGESMILIHSLLYNFETMQ